MLLAVAATTFSKCIAVLEFKINKDYIVSMLCEKRSEAINDCQGTCYLKKKLLKDEDTGKTGVPASKDKTEITLFYETLTGKSFAAMGVPKIFNSAYVFKKYSTLASAVFHPPGRVLLFC